MTSEDGGWLKDKGVLSHAVKGGTQCAEDKKLEPYVSDSKN